MRDQVEFMCHPISTDHTKASQHFLLSSSHRLHITRQPWKVKVKVVQSCPTFFDPMACSPPCSFVHGDSAGKNTAGKNTGVDCCVLLQGIFPTQGSNPGPLHGRQILYHLSQRRSLQTSIMTFKVHKIH